MKLNIVNIKLTMWTSVWSLTLCKDFSMRKIQVLAAFMLSAILLACQSEQPNPPVTADFDYQINGDCKSPTLEVVLENKTLNADAYHWDFGDGTSSDEVNPTKVYLKAGTYKIILTVFSAQDTAQIEKEISIFRNSDGKGPMAELSYKRSNATNLECTFDVKTDATSYRLSFGDGQDALSGESSLIHTYSGRAVYGALLFVENSDGCNCATVMVDLTN